MKRIFLLFLFSSILATASFAAEPDSVIFTNDNYVVGEVKSMQRGVLMMETPFSDKDFAIELDGIKEIYCTTYFLITLTDGRRYNGTINTTEPKLVKILADGGEEVMVNLDDIVLLDDVDQGFWSQFYASIDIGFDLTKANNFRQVSMRSAVGYLAKRYNLDANYNTLNSSQDSVQDIQRTDGSVSFNYYLPKDWYLITSLNFLSNTEQRLNLRSTLKGGLGKYVIHTNRKYWSFGVGVNYNNENFSSEDADRNSMEAFFGSELNLFDVGDIDLLTKVLAYPSLTESGRWRTDFDIQTRYEMPFDDDFYIKLGFTLNYDSQPVEGATDTDYVFHTGFGWEW